MDDKSAAAASLMGGRSGWFIFLGGKVEDVFGFGVEVTLNFPPV